MKILLCTTYHAPPAVSPPDLNLDMSWDESVVWQLFDAAQDFLFHGSKMKFEHFPTSAGNNLRVNQLEVAFISPNPISDFLVNLDEFRPPAKAGLEVNRGTKEFSVLSP